nr:hypothetical protein BaRGS_035152 [Batillaria attramentaria]
MDVSFDVDEITTESNDEITQCRDVTTEREVIDPPDGGWGWVVTGASFMVQFLLDGVSCSFGLVLPDLVVVFGSSLSLTSIAPAAFVAVFLLTGPAAALLVRRFGCRLVGFCGGVIASLGIACCAYSPNIEVFILFFGVVAGFGVGLIYLPSITMSNMYFDRKRGVVAGIITSGSGFGLLALAQLTEVLLDVYGWRGCYLVMGGIVLNFCVCACLMRPLPLKAASMTVVKDPGEDAAHTTPAELTYAQIEDIDVLYSSEKIAPELLHSVTDDCRFSIVSVEEIGEDDVPVHHTSRESVVQAWSSIKNLFLGHSHLGGSHTHIHGRGGAVKAWFLRQRLLLLFLVGAFLIQLTSNVPTLLTPSYAYLYDVSHKQSAQILSIFGLVNTAGRLGAGLLVYWGCGSLRVHNLGTLLGGVACCIFPFCTTFPTIATCLAFYGFFMGAFPPLQPVILAEYLGIERLASVFGTMCFVKAFANLAGAPLAGAVYGVTGLYTIPVAGCGAVLILAALLHELAACCTPPRDHKVSQDHDVTG